MRERVLATIREHRLFAPGERVGVAVSGGADSVALLRVLVELRDELAISLSVLHLHHGLRGEAADGDAKFVETLAKNFGLPFHLRRADAGAYATEHKLSVEAAGRALRYEFFAEMMQAGLDAVATAHTLDDQAETVLLRLLRGAGTHGLAAMRHQRPCGAGRIVRPLLDVGRPEIEAYLQTLGQSWREDASNRNTVYTRNRVRHELLPMLEKNFNPSIRRTLSQTAEIAAAEEEFWQRQVESFFAGAGLGTTDFILKPLVLDGELISAAQPISIEQPRFASQPLALQRRILRAMMQGQGISPEFEVVERARLAILAGKASRQTVAEGLQLRLLRHPPEPLRFCFFHETFIEKPSGLLYDYAIQVPCKAEIAPLGIVVLTSIGNEFSPGQISGRLLNAGLHLRNWLPGDRYHAQGRSGEKKLKELFPLYGVEGSLRPLWPVLCTEAGEIVWVWKLPSSSRWAAGANEQQTISLQILPLAARNI